MTTSTPVPVAARRGASYPLARPWTPRASASRSTPGRRSAVGAAAVRRTGGRRAARPSSPWTRSRTGPAPTGTRMCRASGPARSTPGVPTDHGRRRWVSGSTPGGCCSIRTAGASPSREGYRRETGAGDHRRLHRRRSMKSVVVDLSTYDWEGDQPLGRPLRESVIYEAHVRGLTANPNSGVAPGLRGTYRGLIEKIPYLLDLGVTAVELMPVHQFDRLAVPDGLVNYWGYQTVSFFAPHAAYSSAAGAAGGRRRVPGHGQGPPSGGPRGHPRRGLQPHRGGWRRRPDVQLSGPREPRLLRARRWRRAVTRTTAAAATPSTRATPSSAG